MKINIHERLRGRRKRAYMHTIVIKNLQLTNLEKTTHVHVCQYIFHFNFYILKTQWCNKGCFLCQHTDFLNCIQCETVNLVRKFATTIGKKFSDSIILSNAISLLEKPSISPSFNLSIYRVASALCVCQYLRFFSPLTFAFSRQL